MQAAFADIQSRYSYSTPQPPPGGKPGAKWPRILPEHSTASFAQLMLLHGAGWPNHIMWEHWQAAHAPGSLTMFVHMKVREVVGCQLCRMADNTEALALLVAALSFVLVQA